VILNKYLASSRALSSATARCYQHGAAGLWQVGDTRRNLLMAGDDDEVFMTRNLNVTLKTRVQHSAVRSGKSEAEVTNNRTVRSRYCTIEASGVDIQGAYGAYAPPVRKIHIFCT